MSDQVNLPRVEFNDDGLSMDVEQAVERFRAQVEKWQDIVTGQGESTFHLTVKMRPCDCGETLSGIDEHCPEHGSIDPEGECSPRLKQIFDRIDGLSDEEYVAVQAYIAMRRV